MELCEVCGKEICDNEWACRIEMNRRDGYPELTPNNLPIRCIRADGTMLEHEHGDRPDYLFPVEVEYIGPLEEGRYHLVDGEGNVEVMGQLPRGRAPRLVRAAFGRQTFFLSPERRPARSQG